MNCYEGDTNQILFGISGLNLNREVVYEIDGVTVENQTVEINSSVVGTSQIKVDGAGYTFQVKNANVKVTNAEKFLHTDGGDLIFTAANGTLTVKDGDGKRISHK